MLQKTPLNDAHRALGAKMVPFGGWEMPVQYSGILDEHKAVRERVGVFDVSHMGEIVFRGPRAAEAVQRLVTNDVAKLTDGAAMYSVMCYEDGGIVDDCIVYRRGAEDFLVVVNASNIQKDFAWMSGHAREICPPVDESPETGLVAVQGPEAVALLGKLGARDLASVPKFHFVSSTVAGVPVVLARTGYTGEDGFEVFVPAERTREIWDAVIAGGATPVGLGARDTLRLEAKLTLYGNDIDQSTTPLEAGLGWVVKGRGFLGEGALAQQKSQGIPRKLVGFLMRGRGIARHDYPILAEEAGSPIGKVTSGTTSPTLGVAVGMGYVPTAMSPPGTMLIVDCRGKRIPAEIVAGPFYKRKAA
jgi:aminomethyltransferase